MRSAFAFPKEKLAVTATLAPRRSLVSIAKAADYADVHPMTMRRWISAGRIKAYRLGPRSLRVDLNELDAMLRPIPTAGGHREAS